jgi:hypothetical protein
MDDKRYGVRVSTFKIINPFTIELRGCGQLYVEPGREYYFENAPINFINYVAQLAAMNISYQITPNKKGCFYTIDLTDYFKNDPTYIMSKIRRRENPIIKEPEVKKPEPGKVVLSSDDIAPREDKSSEEIALDNMIAEDLKKSQEQPVITSDVVVEPIQENTPEVVEETEESDESEPKVYTEDQLSKFSKAMLLEISNDYGLDCSDINTKKEIREAILKAQNK